MSNTNLFNNQSGEHLPERGESMFAEFLPSNDKNMINATHGVGNKSKDNTLSILAIIGTALVFGLLILISVSTIISLIRSNLDSDDYSHRPETVQDSKVFEDDKITSETKTTNDVELINSVQYSNLTVGDEYIVRVKLVDEKTNTPIVVDGKEVVFEKRFIAEQENGNVSIPAEFDNVKAETEKAKTIFELYDSEGTLIDGPREDGMVTLNESEELDASDKAAIVALMRAVSHIPLIIGALIMIMGVAKLVISVANYYESETHQAIIMLIAGVLLFLLRFVIDHIISKLS